MWRAFSDSLLPHIEKKKKKKKNILMMQFTVTLGDVTFDRKFGRSPKFRRH